MEDGCDPIGVLAMGYWVANPWIGWTMEGHWIGWCRVVFLSNTSICGAYVVVVGTCVGVPQDGIYCFQLILLKVNVTNGQRHDLLFFNFQATF